MNSEIHPLLKIVKAQKDGHPIGICSICSANNFVIKAALLQGKRDNSSVLIESTCNQVNQFGGYTGMTPVDFKEFVYTLASEINFPAENIILGGDHLGPNVWQNEDSQQAMKKAADMVRQYVLAGYTKIHLDASMHLGDDHHEKPLAPEVIAERGARLCQVAEEAYQQLKKQNPAALQPVYVIGTEVPKPGGTEDEDEELQVTKVEDFEQTVLLSQEAFLKYGLESAWERVIAVVVQPGVEYGNNKVDEYKREEARNLTQALEKYDNLVFEGHSTDYQTPALLKEMVEDGIAILKVGPALTFAAREGLYGLAMIEQELCKYEQSRKLSNFIEVLDMAMLENPANWKSYYQGPEKVVRLYRKYSFSDRSRYYYAVPEVKWAINRLINNLKDVDIPLSLLSQYLPLQYKKIRNGKLTKNPEDLIIDCTINTLDDYKFAVT